VGAKPPGDTPKDRVRNGPGTAHNPSAAGRRPAGELGHPRLHFRQTDSTNERARVLALAGAPHGTLVTAEEQTAGRGRQGRSWTAPARSALLCSIVLRNPPALPSLLAGVAVCDAVGEHARVKWPNDVVVEPNLAKLAGILVEGRPQESWAVLGVGINVAVSIEELPVDLHGRAASLMLPRGAIESTLERLIDALERRLAEPTQTVLDAWSERDALRGREVSWAHPKGEEQGSGRAEGIDSAGRLIVVQADGARTLLDAGEVHLGPPSRQQPGAGFSSHARPANPFP
jgi:BirA family transcriptional regulator, biotin operon repressor / biotin---[acetyl-CoA-carboxylase] ligase